MYSKCSVLQSLTIHLPENLCSRREKVYGLQNDLYDSFTVKTQVL